MRLNEPVPQTEALQVVWPHGDDGRGQFRRRVHSSAHWVKPRYDRPMVAKRPVNHGCRRSHTTVSAPSVTSLVIGSNTPPEPNVPRTLCSTTW